MIVSSTWTIHPDGAVFRAGSTASTRAAKVERACESCGNLFIGQKGRRYCSTGKCAATRRVAGGGGR